MIVSFQKYQGTGNDFVIIDNRNRVFPEEDLQLIRNICHRKFGIGADGLILIQEHPEADFEMIYFNPDGTRSLCGNGSRCAVKFAYAIGIAGKKSTFQASDGFHQAFIENDLVHLKMHDVERINPVNEDFFLNTGSPHHICFTSDVTNTDILQEGRKIRYSAQYQSSGGSNVNFVQLENDNNIIVRTYERGVEDETLSCGTGVTAAALVAGLKGHSSPVGIKTLGGELKVSFQAENGHFTNIYLIGPAEMVFRGEIDLKNLKY
jgi:diaminopimelate epimerase